MTKEAELLEGEALKLSPFDRAWLAERLLLSFDEASADFSEEIKAVWFEEAPEATSISMEKSGRPK